MKRAVGLVIGETSVSAALLRGGVTLWSGEQAISEDDTRALAIAIAMKKLLASAPTIGPTSGRRRLALGVLLQPPLVQVRRLEGLPPLDERLLDRLVSENASSLFLRRDGGLAIGKVERSADALWGAAIDRVVVNEIVAAAHQLRFALRGIAPVSMFVEEKECAPHALCAVASRVDRRTPLVWTPDRFVERPHVRRRLRAAIVSALVTAGVLAWSVPILRAAIGERRMARELAAMHDVETEALRSAAELARVTRSLSERAAFDANRGRVTSVLAAVTQALPDSTAMLSFQADSLDVRLTVLSARVMDMLPALAGASHTASLRLVGPVSHELVNDVRLERAAFRFRPASHGQPR
jgi:hypothetical protein